MEYKRKRTSPADIEDLRADELILRDVANRARHKVIDCTHCDLGWVIEDGHQAWSCPYCTPGAKDTNREWRAVRDQLRDAGVEVDALVPYQYPHRQGLYDPQGVAMVNEFLASVRRDENVPPEKEEVA